MRNTFLISTLVLSALAQPLLAADKDDIPKLKTTVKTLAVFKNGLGFVFRSGGTSLKNGWAAMDEIPPAVLGTLWIGTTNPSARVQEVVSYKCPSEDSVDAANISDLLEANAGRRVTLTYLTHATPETERINATIMSVPTGGQIVLIQAEDGTIGAINKADVLAITLDKDAPLKIKKDKIINCAKLRVGSDIKKGVGKVPSSADITLAYLEKGITWTPGYLINIADKKEVDITMEAVLANDAEDLEDVDVSFVVGYPNFMFADILTPLYLQQSVGDFVGRLAGSPSAPRSSRERSSIMSQSIAYNYASYDSPATNLSWNPESAYSATQPMAGESNEDLYFYNQPHVTLKKGDRARYTVFTGKAPYEHIYEWFVPEEMNIDYRGYRQDNNRREETVAQVWHSLRLTNTTKHPWTTAPAFTVNGSMPVAQDVLKYTPPGGKNTLKLTVATDVRADQTQSEVSRELVKIGRNEYDRITVEGKLTVKNLKPGAVRLNVKKELTGEVLEAGQEGKVSRVAKRLAAVNPQALLEWEFDLDSGSEKQLTYQYAVLLAR